MKFAADAGAKYRGFSFQSEFYWRTLSDFVANGPLPLNSIYDRGFMAEAGYMAVPKTLNVYAIGGYVHDQFRRYPWEAGGGVAYYPSHTRSWRLDLRAVHIDQCPGQLQLRVLSRRSHGNDHFAGERHSLLRYSDRYFTNS